MRSSFVFWSSLIGFVCAVSTCLGQAPKTEGDSGLDSTIVTVAPKTDSIRPGERFDFIFIRGFTVVGSQNDTAAISGSSGSMSFGMSFNLPLNKTISVRLQPAFTLYKLNFTQNTTKTFPSRGDSTYSSEKMRAFYLDVPIGIGIAVARDANTGKLNALFDAGFLAGLLFSSDLKLVQGNTSTRIDHYANGAYNRIRLGTYARLNYKGFGLYLLYHLNDVFKSDATYVNYTGQAVPYPKFPKLEIGVSVVL